MPEQMTKKERFFVGHSFNVIGHGAKVFRYLDDGDDGQIEVYNSYLGDFVHHGDLADQVIDYSTIIFT